MAKLLLGTVIQFGRSNSIRNITYVFTRKSILWGLIRVTLSMKPQLTGASPDWCNNQSRLPIVIYQTIIIITPIINQKKNFIKINLCWKKDSKLENVIIWVLPLLLILRSNRENLNIAGPLFEISNNVGKEILSALLVEKLFQFVLG